jgi:hypothetical protein
MRAILKLALAGVMAAGLAACESTGGGAGAGPCASCSEGVTTVKKTTEKRAFCVVNGKQVDCTKNPAECPACAKAK